MCETETCRVRHEGTTEEPKEVTETEKLSETETQELKEIEETWELEQIEEKLQEIDGHTQVEIMRDNGVELVECLVTGFEHQVNIPQERGNVKLSRSRSRRGESGRAVRG